MTAVSTVRDALGEASLRLAAAGCETPRLDAEVLLAHVFGWDRAGLVVRGSESLDCDARERFERLLERRAAREPVAYIVGFREFRRIRLAVDRRALIPRPETELLVEVGLELPAAASVIDVGTGSGAVALALKDERPDLSVSGSDIDAEAVVLARENAARLGLPVAFFVADLLCGIEQPFDAVLANLPYVAQDTPDLPPEIVVYEPGRALFAGPDGLAHIRRLVAMVQAPVVALEVGAGQAAAVEALLCRQGFGEVQRRRDLAGHERVMVGRGL